MQDCKQLLMHAPIHCICGKITGQWESGVAGALRVLFEDDFRMLYMKVCELQGPHRGQKVTPFSTMAVPCMQRGTLVALPFLWPPEH